MATFDAVSRNISCSYLVFVTKLLVGLNSKNEFDLVAAQRSVKKPYQKPNKILIHPS